MKSSLLVHTNSKNTTGWRAFTSRRKYAMYAPNRSVIEPKESCSLICKIGQVISGKVLAKRCSWCKRTRHINCNETEIEVCDFGTFGKMIVPPNALVVPRTSSGDGEDTTTIFFLTPPSKRASWKEQTNTVRRYYVVSLAPFLAPTIAWIKCVLTVVGAKDEILRL